MKAANTTDSLRVGTTVQTPERALVLRSKSPGVLFPTERIFRVALEKNRGNDTRDSAHSLGLLEVGLTLGVGLDANDLSVSSAGANFVSIDGTSDSDFSQFTLDGASAVGFRLEPRGPSYTYVPEGGGSVSFNALAQSNLSLRVFDVGGILLHDVNAVGLGLAEDFTTAILPAGTYTVRVGGSENRAQMYALTLAVADSDGDGVSDLVESGTGRNPLAASDLAFEFAGDFEGWGAVNNVSGLVQGTAVTEDPNFRVAGLRFHGASISEIVV